MTRTQAYTDITTNIEEALADITTNNIRNINAYSAERAGEIITQIAKCLIKRQVDHTEADELLERVERDIWSF